MSCNECGSQNKVTKYKCPPGIPGSNGWTPVLSVVVDGQRRVEQVVDWIGGTEAKPAINQYVSALGFTYNVAEGTDIRGAAGADGTSGTGGGGATITDITYSALITLIAASGLVEGNYYRLTDFQTKHEITGVSPTVLNAGPVEPLLLLAISSNELAEDAVSETYPQDELYYTVSNTFIAGADKGCILYRKDNHKDISTYYDWRAVKFRRYKVTSGVMTGLYMATNSPFSFANDTDTVDATDFVDYLTFHNLAVPVNCYKIRIGLLNEVDRLNNIIAITQSGDSSYGPSYFNVSIEDGCYSMTFAGSLFDISVGFSVNNIYQKQSFRNPTSLTIESASNNILLSNCINVNIGSGCYNLKVASANVYACSDIIIKSGCVYVNIFPNQSSGSCSAIGIEIGAKGNYLNFKQVDKQYQYIETAPGLSNVTFNSNIFGVNFLVSANLSATYTTDLTGKTIKDQAPDGSVWYDVINNSGVKTPTKWI